METFNFSRPVYVPIFALLCLDENSFILVVYKCKNIFLSTIILKFKPVLGGIDVTGVVGICVVDSGKNKQKLHHFHPLLSQFQLS